MEHYLQYPGWQEPLAAAILERDPQKLPAKLQRAEEIITNRIRELGCDENSGHEMRLLNDGLSILRRIRQERFDC